MDEVKLGVFGAFWSVEDNVVFHFAQLRQDLVLSLVYLFFKIAFFGHNELVIKLRNFGLSGRKSTEVRYSNDHKSTGIVYFSYCYLIKVKSSPPIFIL